jgi:hypothetical protein
VVAGVRERFPQLVARDRQALLADKSIQIVCCAAIPRDRAGIAMAAMRQGKDVMLDKPGIITATDLAAVEQTVAETGRIFSICFSERFVTPSSEIAAQLVQGGAIGRRHPRQQRRRGRQRPPRRRRRPAIGWRAIPPIQTRRPTRAARSRANSPRVLPRPWSRAASPRGLRGRRRATPINMAGCWRRTAKRAPPANGICARRKPATRAP